MIGPLKITALQSDLHWENPEANRQTLGEKLHAAPGADVYILPEMFSTGFSMDTIRLAETMEGPTHQWMAGHAKELDAVVCGSLIIREADRFYNRFLWVTADGKTRYYDKRHRFTMAGEHHHFSAGQSHTIVEIKGWRVMLQVCYDLRFPVWSRNRNNYDLLIYVANWPAARSAAWSRLLPARAIENQCYVAGVNRVGVDGKNIGYSGNSAIIDPKGDYLVQGTPNRDELLTATLSYAELVDFREKFPVLDDADDFDLK
jgi:predicted amidohydrolase